MYYLKIEKNRLYILIYILLYINNMTEIVKLYDINKVGTKYYNKTRNSYDKPFQSLNYILNNYKSYLDISNIFTYPTHILYDDYTNTKIVQSYYDYYYFLI
jgi:hypothetical protein